MTDLLTYFVMYVPIAVALSPGLVFAVLSIVYPIATKSISKRIQWLFAVLVVIPGCIHAVVMQLLVMPNQTVVSANAFDLTVYIMLAIALVYIAVSVRLYISTYHSVVSKAAEQVAAQNELEAQRVRQAEKSAHNEAIVADFSAAMPEQLRFELTMIVAAHLQTYSQEYTNQFKAAMLGLIETTLPDLELIRIDPTGRPWSDFIKEAFNSVNEKDKRTPLAITAALNQLREIRYSVEKIRFIPVLPQRLRTEHHQIIGGIGHGKTSALISLFLDDLEHDAAMVLIDSQGDLINALATRVPLDRLVLIDPDCPPAMNIFDVPDKSEHSISNALTILDYMFASGGMVMTAKQSSIYSYLARLCMAIPDANIRTFRNLLKLEKISDYQKWIDKLDIDDRDFWASYTQKGNDYNSTRMEMETRVGALMNAPMFKSMFTASKMKLDVAKALDEGKIILVNASTSKLGKASPVIGRLFIAQVMQAVRDERRSVRKRVYLYVDEFADYADDSKMLTDCFKEGRKYNLAMVICFQILKPLPEGIRSFIAGCTSIKFAGGVSVDDITYMAKQMDTEVSTIRAQKKGTFLAYFKDIGVMPWPVEFGRIDKVPQVTNLATVQARMRELYAEGPELEVNDVPEDAADVPPAVTIRPRVRKPKAHPDDDDEFEDAY